MSGTRQKMRLFAAAVSALVALLAHADERARFLFELDGIPVGTVELALNDREYRYTSTHLFARGHERQQTRIRSASFRITDVARDAETGDLLESLWLWRRPDEGCQQVRAEIDGRRSLACVHYADGEHANGTLGDEAFQAEYRAGRLRTLSLGRAKFARVGDAVTGPTAPPMFEEGWAIAGRRGKLQLEGFPTAPSPARSRAVPEWKSARLARALAREVRRQFDGDPDATFVDHVRSFAHLSSRRGLGGVLIVHGLVAERGGDRALPHVWIRVPVSGAWLDLDPGLGVEVTPETHVALAYVPAHDSESAAGRRWLAFTSSSARVVRAEGRHGPLRSYP